MAMGNAMTAEADSADALFYNVAGLARARSQVTTGLMLGMDNARIRLNPRPAGYDIPDLGAITPTIPSAQTQQARADTERLGSWGMLTLGGVTTLSSQRLRVAALIALPVLGNEGASTFFADERERLFSNQLQWAIIGQRARRFDIETGFAYRLLDRLGIGIGIHLQPTVDLRNDVYLQNATDQAQVDINLSQKQGFQAALTGGLLLEVSESLRVGLAARQALGFRIEGSNEIQIRGFDAGTVDEYPIQQPIGWIPSSSPGTVSLGASTDIARATFALDFRYTIWSQYRDTQGDRAGFVDTITPRAGLEYRYSDATTARLGAAWEPSPVVDQVGRTNYVDNDRLLGSIGAAHRFSVLERDLEISWYVQAQALLQRQTAKEALVGYPACQSGVTQLCDEVPDGLLDPRNGLPVPGTAGLQTGNPGFPGFAAGGWLGALGVELRWFL
jgi:hypothetical protein